MRTHFIFYAAVLIVLIQICDVNSDEQHANYCTTSEIEASVKECKDVYAGGNKANLERLCPHVECYLECLKDATGDCLDKELFVADLKVEVVALRAQCANIKLSKLAEEFCIVDTPCIDETFHTESVGVMNNLRSVPHNTQSKVMECRLASKALQCTTVNTTANCTQDMARFLRNKEIVQHSLSKCDIPQNHPWFKTYGNDIDCDDSKLDSKCFTGRVMERLAKCKPIVSSLESFLRQDASVREDICDDVECISECYEEALDGCANKEKFAAFEPTRVKISTRAVCAHEDELEEVMEHCKLSSNICLQDLSKALDTAHEQLMPNHRYDEYKSLLCNATAEFRSCVSFPKTEDCTESMAELATNIYQTWYSYAGCGPVHSAFYHKYDGDLECDGAIFFVSFLTIATATLLSLFVI